jgi:sorbose reductase
MGTAIEIANLKSIKERMSFEGKKGFVTGAAGGIGRSTAAALAELGGRVALVDINVEKAAENAREINARFGTDCFAVKCDVSSPESVSIMMTEVLDKMGEINFVHSNAGIIAGDDNVDMPYESWERMVRVNLTGMMLIDQAVGRQMKAQGKGGAVVNTGSMSGHIVNNTHGTPNNVCYTATKAGVIHLTKSFAAHYATDNIRYNCISPGYMLSGIHDGLPQELLDTVAKDSPINRFGTMDEIGGLVAFLLSDLATFIIGSDVLVDGGHCIW